MNRKGFIKALLALPFVPKAIQSLHASEVIEEPLYDFLGPMPAPSGVTFESQKFITGIIPSNQEILTDNQHEIRYMTEAIENHMEVFLLKKSFKI